MSIGEAHGEHRQRARQGTGHRPYALSEVSASRKGCVARVKGGTDTTGAQRVSDTCVCQAIGGSNGIVDKSADGAGDASVNVGHGRARGGLDVGKASATTRQLGSSAGAEACKAAEQRGGTKIGSDLAVASAGAKDIPAGAEARDAGKGKLDDDGVVIRVADHGL